MTEPSNIRYNRQIGQSIYLFWLVEPSDLSALMGALTINMMLFESFSMLFWTLVLYIGYVVAFRAGRPRGYDRHFFGHLFAPPFMRMGRANAHWPFRSKNGGRNDS